jgi:hypothetical protein
MEAQLKEQKKNMKDLSLNELEVCWKEAKKVFR